MKKILLGNWSHTENKHGGVESRYKNIQRAFPDSESISYETLFKEKPRDFNKAAKQLGDYYEKRYKKDKNILVIRDAACGKKSDILQITIFGNPYATLAKHFNRKFYKEMSELRLGAHNTFKVANSNFMVEDMKKIDLKADAVIPNCVDTEYFKPLNNKDELRKKYYIPLDVPVGIFVGDNIDVKNNVMMRNLFASTTNVFWVIVTKSVPCRPLIYNMKEFFCIPKDILLELYNCADFSILTSPVEGCNNTIFEAMSCGLPCIVSKTGYFWDFWDEKVGCRVKYDDLVQHREAVEYIIKKKHKLNPRQVIFDRKLDLESYKEKWEDIINDI